MSYNSGFRITGNDSQYQDLFGWSTSLNSAGNIALVGAAGDDIGALGNAGSAYIFTGSGLNWTQVAKITGSDEEGDDTFGNSIALNSIGNIALIGAPNKGPLLRQGAAYIFTGNGNNWVQAVKINASDPAVGDYFGTSVSINSAGNVAIVTAPYQNAGAAYIFTGSGSNWVQTTKITPSDGVSDDAFGTSVSINSAGNVVLVGGFDQTVAGQSYAGAAYVFTGSGSNWVQTKKITASDPSRGAQFSENVSLNSAGNVAAIAARWWPNTTPLPPDARRGAVYIYTGNGSNWTETIKLTGDQASLFYGTSLSLNSAGNTLAVGTRRIIDIFTGSGTNWIKTQRINPSGTNIFSDSSINSISLNSSGDIILAGTPYLNNSTGAAYIFTTKSNQNITFPIISDKSFGDPAFFLSGSSDSNLPLTYSGSNNLVANISGASGVKINNVGSVTITANQAGNSDFEPAIPVTQSFNVICDYVKEVIAGTYHSLALLKDGRVTGWGSNFDGQINIPIGIGTGAAQVSAGDDSSLALLKDGRVTGWGDNTFGQINIPVGIGTGAAQISEGIGHSIALLKDGRVTGWGRNDHGQINIPVGIGTGAVQVIAGGLHSLALLKEGRVTGWGNNVVGQTTIPVGIGTNAVAIDAGVYHSLALLKDGRVTGWGLNTDGQTTIPIGIGNNATGISAGQYFSLALLKDGRVTGWGDNDYGQTTIPVGIGTGAAQVSAGYDSSLALLKDGRVTGWGNNGGGQLNVPKSINCTFGKPYQNITFPEISDKSFADPVFLLSGFSDSNLPLSYSSSNVLVASISGATGVKINNVGSVTITATQAGNSDFEPAIPVSRSFNVVCDYVKQIGIGDTHSLILLKDGRVTGWGNNAFGQTNIPVGIGTNAAAISAGQGHSLALLKDGRVTGWGYNFYGQNTIPIDIGTGAAQISAGQNHNLALLKDGRVTGWGNNAFGQTTIPVGIGTGAAQVSAGFTHNLVLLKDGSVFAWGFNSNGQTTTPVGIGTGAAQVGAGFYHSLALLKDGRVTGWGDNSAGQITIPVSIGTGAAQISAGLNYNLALLKDGRVTGWGSNLYGESTIPVGIGTGAAQVSAGWYQSFALLKDGRVTGWGRNNYGQLNVPKSINCTFGPVYQNITFPEISDKNYGTSPFYLSGFSDSNLPLTYSSSNSSIASIISGSGIQVNNFGNVTITASQNGNSNFEPAPSISQSFNVICNNVKDISAGNFHSLALLKNGRVIGWGNNDYGAVLGGNSLTGVITVSAGLFHSLAVLDNGKITGWGGNGYGQVASTTIYNDGNLNFTGNWNSSSVGILTGVISVSVGEYYSSALLNNGRVTGWGLNNDDVLLGGNSLTGVIKISAGGQGHLIALLNNGNVTGWGANGVNQAFGGNNLTGVIQIEAGYAHSLALLNNGKVTGWGFDDYGQAFGGNSLTGVISISAGKYYSLALLENGKITGWGRNFNNEINIPVGIGSEAASISAGWFHSLAILKDGRITGWGENIYDQLNVPRTLNCLPLNSSRVISAPTSTYILSGQNLSNAPLIGGSGDVPGSFSWTDSSFVPSNVGRFSYSVTFVPSDIGSYTTSSTGSFVNVLGIPNIITKPTGTSIKYGQTLVNSNLTDGVAEVAGTFNWTNPQTIANNNTGINNYPVTFVPDSEYYINALTDGNVNVTKGDQIINFPNITNKILGASFVLNATSNIGSIINYSTNDTDLISLNNVDNNTIVISNSLGSPTITANASGNQFYDAAPSVSRTFNITQLPFISENDLNLNLNFGNLTNNLNFDIELSGSPLVTKSFDIENNEPFYIGLEKDHVYTINVKSREKLFEFGNKTGTKVISSNSYVNTANLNIDFSENEPQLDISTEVTDFLSLVYRLDNIITPSGIESVNENQLKAFTIDYKTYVTGEVLDINEIPYLSYRKYELENYCAPKQVVIQPTTTEEDPCSVDFTCAICSSALKIRSNNPSQTFIDIPEAKMPYRIYGNLVDYIFTNANPGFYRIALNDKLFSLCCQCKESVECTKELGAGGAGGVGGGDTAFIECKQNNLFDRPKNVNENSLNQKYGLYFLDAITLKSISTNYGPNSYYSGEIKNANSFAEGDKIAFKQYSYNFEQAYADIYLNNPVYKPVDAEFIYSSTVTGDKYFYTISQLVDKINLIYNSTGIYTWLPMLYSKKPYYNYGPMLFAELKDESTVGLTSLKSGRLGEHIISLISAPRPSAIINSYLVPKTIELQGSDDGLTWNKIISSKDVQPVNVLGTSYIKAGGNINYEAVDNTKVTREITVPISSTTGNRIVPSGTTATSGELSNLIDQIESGNKQFATGNGATIVCVPTAGKVSNICGSGYIELWIPSGCPVPDLQPQESGIKEDNEDGDKTEENTDKKTILVEESVFRLGFTDYR